MHRTNRVSTELYQKMPTLLQYLSPREQKILTMYHGLESEPVGYKEIGKLFGVSGETIRVLERKALHKLEKLKI